MSKLLKIVPWRDQFKVQHTEAGKSKTTFFPTLQDAEVFVSAYAARKQSKKPAQVQPEQDLEKLITAYLAFTLGNKRKHTIKNVGSILRQTLPRVNWREPDQTDLFAYCIERKYKSSTAKGHMKWVQSFCKYNKVDVSKVDWKRLNQALSKEDKKEKPYLTHDDFAKLLGVITPLYSLIYRYMGACGIRVTEFTRLDREDFTPATWTVTLPPKKSKTKVERTFIVPNEFRKDFLELTNALSTDPKAPLFYIDKKEKRISAGGLSIRFRTHCDKAGLGKRNIHLLRAFAILILLRGSGNDYELVRNVCGWDSQEMKKYMGQMEQAKAELASNLTFAQVQIDSTREMDLLVSSILGIVVEEGEDPTEAYKSLSAKTGITYAWVFNFLQNKKSPDVENLLRIVKHLDHKLEVYGDQEKRKRDA